MPFTLSHPAAALILMRSGLPMVGLVAGSVVPDAPMIAAVPYDYGRAHSPTGVITVDLAAGIAAALVWTFLVRSLVVDASPAWVRERTAVSAGFGGKEWLLLPVAVVVGAATHVVWDDFTHQGRWGAIHIAWLADDHLGYAGYHWAQAASSVLGLVIVAVVGSLTLARRPRHPNPARVPTVARWSAAAAAGVAIVAAMVAGVLDVDRGPHAAAIVAAEHGMGVLAIAAVVAAVVWQIADWNVPPA